MVCFCFICDRLPSTRDKVRKKLAAQFNVSSIYQAWNKQITQKPTYSLRVVDIMKGNYILFNHMLGFHFSYDLI